MAAAGRPALPVEHLGAGWRRLRPTHGFRAEFTRPSGHGRTGCRPDACRERLAALVAGLQATASNDGGSMPVAVDPQAPFLQGLTDCPDGDAYSFERAGRGDWVFCESHGLTGRACLAEEGR